MCGENAYSRATRSASSGSSPRVRGKLVQQGQILVRHGLIPACAGKTLRLLGRRRGPGAHPRVCGENCTQPSPPWPLMGSSPRVRGKQEGAGGEPCRVGLIPACAGKTGSPASLTSGGRAHPRVCGENEGALRSVLARWGSSPRVRGKLTPITIVAIPTRLIPACAGKTVRDRSRAAADRAHPRVCGENALVVWENVEGAGSSPRVRGKRRADAPEGGGCRLIPACAGKTQLPERGVHAPRAHPRVCGENVANAETMSRAEGSSPRVRGKRDHHRAHRRPRRLIPACAGKTLFSGRLGIRVAAHPRVCGENAGILGMKLLAAGSSPRVRGKHRRLPQPHRERGLIPACAGKTPVGGSPMRGCRAHPRVCGENDLLITHPGPVEGSSPRVRGKLLFFVTHSLHLRLIPACAGKTLQVRCRGHTTEAHPRVCGENARRPLRVRLLRGSSPRVRGKPGGAATARRRPGLIPACAGKTCGALLPRSGSPGSSPRVRGKLDIYLWLSHRLWLIPACAGKTGSHPAASRAPTAHPRVCGENL